MTTKQIKLLKAQAKTVEAVEHGIKYIMFSGGIGNGKTFLCCWICLKVAIENPNIRIVIARNSFTNLKRTTMWVFLNEVFTPELRAILLKKYNKTDSLIELNNGSEIYFIDLENESKILGMEIGFAYIDEAKEIKKEVFEILLGRMRQKCGTRQILLSTNPDTPQHYLYKLFFESNDKDFKVIEAETKENKYLPDDYLKTVYSLYTGTYLDRYLCGKWVGFEGLVYSEFIPSIHLTDAIPYDNTSLQHFRFYRAIDWGYTNPAVCLFIAVDKDDNITVIDEIYITKTLIGEFITLIKQKQTDKNFDATFADPSEPAYIEECNQSGVYIQPANNSVIGGIQKVKSMFGIDEKGITKLKIMRNCVNLIRELQLYRWQDSKDGKQEKEEPLKLHDHACDALRYFVNSFEINNTGIEIEFGGERWR